MTGLVSLRGGPVSLIEALVLSASWGEGLKIRQWADLATNDARRTPSKPIDELDGLEAVLTRRVLARLSSGEWIAEGFRGGTGPEVIDKSWWRRCTKLDLLISEAFWNDTYYVGTYCAGIRVLTESPPKSPFAATNEAPKVSVGLDGKKPLPARRPSDPELLRCMLSIMKSHLATTADEPLTQDEVKAAVDAAFASRYRVASYKVPPRQFNRVFMRKELAALKRRRGDRKRRSFNSVANPT